MGTGGLGCGRKQRNTNIGIKDDRQEKMIWRKWRCINGATLIIIKRIWRRARRSRGTEERRRIA
jgi:hypothetical protein